MQAPAEGARQRVLSAPCTAGGRRLECGPTQPQPGGMLVPAGQVAGRSGRRDSIGSGASASQSPSSSLSQSGLEGDPAAKYRDLSSSSRPVLHIRVVARGVGFGRVGGRLARA